MLQAVACEQTHIRSKMTFITDTGVDAWVADVATEDQSAVNSGAVIDITEAQEREAERRRLNMINTHEPGEEVRALCHHSSVLSASSWSWPGRGRPSPAGSQPGGRQLPLHGW